MDNLITLLKKNLGIITVVLMLGWGVGMALALPPMAAAGCFCLVIVTVVRITRELRNKAALRPLTPANYGGTMPGYEADQ